MARIRAPNKVIKLGKTGAKTDINVLKAPLKTQFFFQTDLIPFSLSQSATYTAPRMHPFLWIMTFILATPGTASAQGAELRCVDLFSPPATSAITFGKMELTLSASKNANLSPEQKRITESVLEVFEKFKAEDWAQIEAAIRRVPEPYQIFVFTLIDVIRKVQQGESTLIEAAVRIMALQEFLPPGERPTWFGPVQTFLRLSEGDMTFLNQASDRMLREERYEEWLRMVSFAQKASLSPEWKGAGPEAHATWSEFSQRMGLVGITESRRLFQHELQWISAKSLRRHFTKRQSRGELDVQSEADLVHQASEFLRSERDGQIVFRQKEDIIIKYDSTTEQIAVVNHEGKIITYFYLLDSYRKSQSREYFLGHFLLGLPYSTDTIAP